MLRAILRNAFLGLLLVIMTFSALGGIAAAVWSAMGSGNASGGTGTTVAVTLTPGTPTTLLYPGSKANVVLRVVNTNAATVRIGSLAVDTSRGTNGFAADAAHAGCVLSALTFTAQTNGTAGWTVAGKVGAVDGTLDVSLPNALQLGLGAVNACQGATFTVFLLGQP